MQQEKRQRITFIKNHICFLLGLAAVFVMLIPYLILGEDAIVTYHDQLDGEFIAYILQARHLFRGKLLPEFMGGMFKSALTMPAPIYVLLFLKGNYFEAYVIMQLAGSLAGYIGMYLLGRDLTRRKWIGLLTGVMFAYLPFLPVYGLSQYGIPLLIWCFWQLQRGKNTPLCVGYAALYAMASSLVLVGFAVLGCLAAAIIFQKKGKKKIFVLPCLLMLFIYIVENMGLLMQIIGGVGEVSHKSEYVLSAAPFWNSWWTVFINGIQHAEDYHQWILAAAVFLLAVVGISRIGTKISGKSGRRASEASEMLTPLSRKLFLLTLTLLGINLFLSLVAAFWGASLGIALRNRMQALKGFQMNRVMWVTSAFWYIILSCLLGIGAEWFGDSRKEEKSIRKIRGIKNVITVSVLIFITGITGMQILWAGNLKPNVQKLMHPDYSMLSFSDYYAIGVMDQVHEYLAEVSGKDVSEYRVASLGIDPAAAYYEGFYCLDGYSNNYSLDYKHLFRKILLPELKKNAYLAENFDNWGNRCYLFSSECPGYYTIEKGGFFFQNYELDMEAFKEMGGRYLLSAAYILNSGQQGLRLLREEPFETQDSYYRIFVYEAVD